MNEEFRIIRPDGAVRWIWIRSYPIRDDAGRSSGFAGVERDVTVRKAHRGDGALAPSITRQLNSTLDVRTPDEALVKETLAILDAQGIRGADDPAGMTAQILHDDRGQPFAHHWPAGHGLAGWVAEHGRPYLTNDGRHRPQIDRDIQDVSPCARLCAPSSMRARTFSASSRFTTRRTGRGSIRRTKRTHRRVTGRSSRCRNALAFTARGDRRGAAGGGGEYRGISSTPPRGSGGPRRRG